MEYSKQDTPLQCEREPIHIVNRIQPCGTLLVVDSDLRVVQCSANAVNMLPRDYVFNLDEDVAVPNGPTAESMGLDPRLDSIIGNDLSLLLQPEAVEQIASLVSICSTGRQSGTHHQRKTSVIRDSRRFSRSENNSDSGPGGRRFSHTDSLASSFSSLLGSVDEPEGVQFSNSGDAARNFLIRSKGTSTMNAEKRSCSVTQSGEFFLLELEDLHLGLDDDAIPNWGKFNGAENDGEEEDTAMTVVEDLGDRDVMLFMEGIAKELRQCWSIEEMASLVCSRIMAETPYDRGMVYRFDPGDDSGEVIYESFRRDARQICRKDPWLGLRFPASDIPRQARELFMRNTLRYIYDVNGNDWPLYPSKTRGSKVGGDPRYTDLSMCRLRGSSYVHLEYLRNMQVTSSLTIAIIVNKRLWGLYSFHGYREPIMPNARTRFLCEMASIMTSMVMESLTKVEEHRRLMDMERTMVQLHSKYPSMTEFMEVNYEVLMNLLDINMISFRIHRPVRNIHSFQMGKPSTSEKVEDGKNGDSFERGGILSDEVFDCLYDTYGQVCRDYGTVFIDEQKSHPTLVAAGLHTLAFFHLKGIDVVLSRQAVVEKVQWGGDPDKKLEPNGTLTPRNSFAAYVKGHLKKGKPWDEADKTIISRLAEQIEKYRTNEVFAEQTEAIQTLTEQKQQALEESRSNFDFFALMAHELRTPFHGILGSLEAMREDPALANNEMLRTAELCGKNMIKILDDILLVAKGSYSLKLEEQSVDVLDFLRQAIADMTSYAYMEGVSIRVRKEDVYHSWLYSDFSRIRQVVHNLISNAIKFSDRSGGLFF